MPLFFDWPHTGKMKLAQGVLIEEGQTTKFVVSLELAWLVLGAVYDD